jgi:NADPH-dependent curcumin reductase CurA
MAKLMGLRVIGSAGSTEKVEWLRSLGIEAFDYRETSSKEALSDGIDVYFDNVGGAQLEAALFALRPFGRVVACGAISRYNDERPESGPRNLGLIVTKRLRVQGFIVLDHADRYPAFFAEVGPWVRDGKISCRETILRGLEQIHPRSPASSVATTSARCSSASGPMRQRTNASPSIRAARPGGS